MSIINLSFDTKEKKLEVSMDGKKIDKVSSIYIYNYEMEEDESEGHIEITRILPDEEEGLYKRECICASKNNIIKTVDKVLKGNKYAELSEKLSKAMGLKNENL